MDTFGARVARARGHLKITQAQLAERAAYKQAHHVSSIENGHVSPRIDSALALANALGVHVDWLLTGDASRAPEWLVATPNTDAA